MSQKTKRKEIMRYLCDECMYNTKEYIALELRNVNVFCSYISQLVPQECIGLEQLYSHFFWRSVGNVRLTLVLRSRIVVMVSIGLPSYDWGKFRYKEDPDPQ